MSAIPPVADPDAPLDVDALRAREFAWMDDGRVVYLNAASTGPMPARAVAVADEWSRLRGRPHAIAFPRMLDAAATARAQFAALIGARASEVALLPNTTYGLNLAARALPLRPGVVLTFDGEFPSCVYPFMALGGRGITLERIPLRDGLPDEDALVHAIGRGDVVAVVVSWVQFASGFVADLARIGEACRAHDVFFIVDAIQGVGIRPLDVAGLHIDVLASGAQKWQLSPWGTGFAWIRPDLVQSLEPHDVGWACMKASRDYNHLTAFEYDFVDDARRFEVVTMAIHDFAVANASTGLLLELGVTRIAAHIASLIDRFLDWSVNRPDIRVTTPRDGARRAGVLTFTADDMARTTQLLKRAGVVFVQREGAIRLAPHVYNTLADIDRVTAALDE